MKGKGQCCTCEHCKLCQVGTTKISPNLVEVLLCLSKIEIMIRAIKPCRYDDLSPKAIHTYCRRISKLFCELDVQKYMAR